MLLLALAVMPLQGVAATLSVLFCHDTGQIHALHDQGSHDHGVNDGSPPDEGSPASHFAYHPCGSVTALAPSNLMLPAALPDFPIRAFVPDSFHDLFVPDLPHRPPLT